MCHQSLVGNYVGTRVKTIYNTVTQESTEEISNMRIEITKITNNQYLMNQINLNSGSTNQLLFFRTNTGYLSSSLTGIDSLFFDDCDCDCDLIHSWSQPISSEGILYNARTVLEPEIIFV
jgi:hypothetical protein